MTKEEWSKTYDELDDLKEEFFQKWRKNNFRYRTEFLANEKRVSEIINAAVRIIQQNEELREFIFNDVDKNHVTYENNKDYMESNGFWEEGEFHRYIQSLLRMIEKQIDSYENIHK